MYRPGQRGEVVGNGLSISSGDGGQCFGGLGFMLRAARCGIGDAARALGVLSDEVPVPAALDDGGKSLIYSPSLMPSHGGNTGFESGRGRQ